MDYEQNDDRPTDYDDELEQGGQAGPNIFADELAFEAPDLATAFLAALDAVDDRRFVTPLPDPDSIPTPTTEPEPIAAALEPGTLEMPSVDAQATKSTEPANANIDGIDAYVIEHDEAPAAPASAPVVVDSAPARALAEAFAREQAALELWGSDNADDAWATTTESSASTDDLEAPASAAASAEAVESEELEASTELIAETVSNADSYYDPDTLALAHPLFSPDEPRAFATPVHVGHGAAHGATDGSTDIDAELLEDLEEFVAFSLGETRCVVPIRNVIEIGRIPDAVGVPNAPTWLHGLGNLRGQVVSLIDLRAFLGIGRVRPATGRMLVLRADDVEVQAGLLVDHVHQIVSLSSSRFHAVPETLPQHYARHAWGVCDYGNFTMIGLDVDSLLGAETLTPKEAEAV